MKTVKIISPLLVVGFLSGCVGPAATSYGYDDDIYYEPFYNDSVYFQPSYYSPVVIGSYGYRPRYYSNNHNWYYNGTGYQRGYHGGGGYQSGYHGGRSHRYR